MRRLVLFFLAMMVCIVAYGDVAGPRSSCDELAAAERAFAASMADRDFEAFASFISVDAVFLNGGNPLRGRAAILEHWSRHFAEGTPAPFSWEPELAEVSGDGTLGTTNGPVRNPEGRIVARFYSTWRIEQGQWRIVFDNGYAVCP